MVICFGSGFFGTSAALWLFLAFACVNRRWNMNRLLFSGHWHGAKYWHRIVSSSFNSAGSVAVGHEMISNRHSKPSKSKKLMLTEVFRAIKLLEDSFVTLQATRNIYTAVYSPIHR
jgi:hypothetical protein